MIAENIISKDVGIKKSEILVGSSGQYFGGLLKYLVDKPLAGTIAITLDSIVFVSTTFFKKNRIIIKIPLKKIIFDEISEVEKEDIDKDNFMTAMSFFAGYGPMSTFKHKNKVIKIPFKDENNKKQHILFSISKQQKFGETLHKIYMEKLKRKKK